MVQYGQSVQVLELLEKHLHYLWLSQGWSGLVFASTGLSPIAAVLEPFVRVFNQCCPPCYQPILNAESAIRHIILAEYGLARAKMHDGGEDDDRWKFLETRCEPSSRISVAHPIHTTHRLNTES